VAIGQSSSVLMDSLDRPADSAAATSLLSPRKEDFASLALGEGPYLLVVVDAEEEFDWLTFASTATSVKTMRCQVLAQKIFERYGVVPTYAVDYPVANQEAGYRPLREFLTDGRCQIGAQLHPWVTPPIVETIGVKYSYPGNLSRELEYDKLRQLTMRIEEAFGIRPTLYRAGRYGTGPNTPEILHALAYQIDCSVVPWSNLSWQGGPDYSSISARPYWFGPNSELLEIPVTAALLGVLRTVGQRLFSIVSSPIFEACRIPGICARLGLLERIKLTPEGTKISEAMRLTRALLKDNRHQVFVLSYHSPSLEPGHTPYVRTRRDLDRFLAWIEEYLAFFFEEIGGFAATPDIIRSRMRMERMATQTP
jgi:hypothetical protein